MSKNRTKKPPVEAIPPVVPPPPVPPAAPPAPKSFPNLKPFQSGHDDRRNLKGRPVVTDIKKYIKQRLNEDSPHDPERTKLDALIDKMIERANKGNLKALELCLSYGYGRPTQGLELSAPGGGPILTHDFSGLSSEQIRERIEQLKAITELPEEETDGDAGTD